MVSVEIAEENWNSVSTSVSTSTSGLGCDFSTIRNSCRGLLFIRCKISEESNGRCTVEGNSNPV